MYLLKIFRNFIFNLFWIIRDAFWKRDKSIVLLDCWCGSKFADNPRFLFQFLHKNKKELGLSHVVWVTRNFSVYEELNKIGYECYMLNSKESKYYHKHAYYHVINNFPNNNGKFKGELLEGYSYYAKRINLWHGIVGKGVKFANKEQIKKLNKIPGLYKLIIFLNKIKLWRLMFEQKGGWGESYFLVQSTENLRTAKLTHRLPDKNYIFTGYPRVNKCEYLLECEKNIIEKIQNFKYVFLYLPTFRDSKDFNPNFIYKINKILEKKNILWIQKLHSASNIDLMNDASNNIISLDKNFDINVLFPFITTLVTDYSSCFEDALFFKKNIVFYVPDYNDYVSKDRGLMFNLDEIIGNKKIETLEEFSDYLRSFDGDNLVLNDLNYMKTYEMFWNETKDFDMKKIWNDIIKHVN